MLALAASVGYAGRNRRSDVLLVQTLLNAFIVFGKLPGVAPLSIDGYNGPKTMEAIRKFQKRIVGMTYPDGRVDVGHATIAALLGKAPGPKPTPAKPTPPSGGPTVPTSKVGVKHIIGVILADLALKPSTEKNLRMARVLRMLKKPSTKDDHLVVDKTNEFIRRSDPSSGVPAVHVRDDLGRMGWSLSSTMSTPLSLFSSVDDAIIRGINYTEGKYLADTDAPELQVLHYWMKRRVEDTKHIYSLYSKVGGKVLI